MVLTNMSYEFDWETAPDWYEGHSCSFKYVSPDNTETFHCGVCLNK